MKIRAVLIDFVPLNNIFDKVIPWIFHSQIKLGTNQYESEQIKLSIIVIFSTKKYFSIFILSFFYKMLKNTNLFLPLHK